MLYRFCIDREQLLNNILKGVVKIMKEKEYKKHVQKIYISCMFGFLYIGDLFIYLVKSPGKFQEMVYQSKIELIIILILGIVYVLFMINFLSTSKSVQCLHYYKDKKTSFLNFED